MKSKTKITNIPPEVDMADHKISAIIVCAGRGERTGLPYNKILYHVGQKTVIEYVLDVFSQLPFAQIMLVVAPEDERQMTELSRPYENITLCHGGDSRPKSVYNGLHAINPCDIVVIHDGARPYIKTQLIEAGIISAIHYGSGITAVPTVDTIKEVYNNDVVRSLSRSGLYNIQTPQTFRYGEILAAYEKVSGMFTDDAEVYEAAGYKPHIVVGSYDNIKITTDNDLFRTMPMQTKIGIGFDVHKLVPDRKLVLGGVTIPFDKGLEGHSDADVLTHAVMDALLSAAGMADIGVQFPDNDPATENISSVKLLDMVVEMLRVRHFEIISVSAVIMAQQPKLAPYIKTIRDFLAAHMKIVVSRVNVSATTTEGMGIIGEGFAMAASASCLIGCHE